MEADEIKQSHAMILEKNANEAEITPFVPIAHSNVDVQTKLNIATTSVDSNIGATSSPVFVILCNLSCAELISLLRRFHD